MNRFNPAICTRSSWPVLLSTLLAVACASTVSMSFAQTALKPPQPPQGSQLQQPAAKPATPANAPTALTAPAAPTTAAPSKSLASSTPAVAGNPTTLTRFKMVKVDGKMLDLSKLPDSTVLKGKSGRTISVARIKQLQARIDGASTAPMINAQKGQSLKSLASAPKGTMVALHGGKVVRSQDMAKIQTVVAKLNVKRVIRPAPLSSANANARAQAVVGQNGLTLAGALKRPAGEMIQVGTRKYTVEQLRQMDALLKASPREPRGLLDRSAAAGRSVGSVNTPRAVPAPGNSLRKGDGK